MELKQHPLSHICPRLSLEEIDSICECEGLVVLTPAEKDAITSSKWFSGLSASRRVMFGLAIYEWAAQGSNQHVVRLDPRSPMARARMAREAIARAAQ